MCASKILVESARVVELGEGQLRPFAAQVVGPTVRPWRRRCSLVLALCCSVPWLPRRTQAARLVGHSVSEFGASAQTHWMEISF